MKYWRRSRKQINPWSHTSDPCIPFLNSFLMMNCVKLWSLIPKWQTNGLLGLNSLIWACFFLLLQPGNESSLCSPVGAYDLGTGTICFLPSQALICTPGAHRRAMLILEQSSSLASDRLQEGVAGSKRRGWSPSLFTLGLALCSLSLSRGGSLKTPLLLLPPRTQGVKRAPAAADWRLLHSCPHL